MADPRIERVLETEGAEREREIGDLIANVARPQARRVIRRYMRGEGLTAEDAEDVVATLELRLLAKLRSAESDESILDFAQYVAKLTFNILSDHFRRRFPHRTRLKNRLRYTLTHDPRLALWMAGERLACGLVEWQGTHGASAATAAIPPRRNRDAPAAALVAIFRSSGEALDFEELINRLAEEWHVMDAPLFETAASTPPADESYEVRELLAALWREVLELRPMQRKALLLNLRDAETTHVLSLFVLADVAGIDAIASALEMSRASLDAMWNDLPLDDLRIAAMLGVTRQQVINLRKSARERLTRRVPKRKLS
jgi:RNA polymerase sigma factor (sigma-70 family)